MFDIDTTKIVGVSVTVGVAVAVPVFVIVGVFVNVLVMGQFNIYTAFRLDTNGVGLMLRLSVG